MCTTWHHLDVAPHHCHELLSKRRNKNCTHWDASNTVINGKFTLNINWCRIFVHQHYAWRHKYHLANLWITTFIRSSKSMDPSPLVSTTFRSDTVGQRPTSWSLQSLQFAIYNTFWRLRGCAWPFTSQTGCFLCNNIGVLISTTGCSVRNKVQNQKGQSFSSPNKQKNQLKTQSDFRK